MVPCYEAGFTKEINEPLLIDQRKYYSYPDESKKSTRQKLKPYIEHFKSKTESNILSFIREDTEEYDEVEKSL